MPYGCFHLVLMVTHNCNLRCDYCYVGRKSARSLPEALGLAAIDRALHSLAPGGILELGFFGGEPLLEAALIERFLDYAAAEAEKTDVTLRAALTTNGTIDAPTAWRLLTRPNIDLCVSCDGLPEVHDRHRRDAAGSPTSSKVLATLRRLQDAGRAVRAVTVVRPDSLEQMPDGIAWLREQGVLRTDLTLDVWARWTAADMQRLEQAIAAAADVWLAGLPRCGVNWFDEKAAVLAGAPLGPTARCAFGDGEIAVAPSGNLYPCERLIGEDGAEQPMRLAGHVLTGRDFGRLVATNAEGPALPQSPSPCSACVVEQQCGTQCRCANYVRTGCPERPDGLLCLLDRVCLRETARVLARLPSVLCASPC